MLRMSFTPPKIEMASVSLTSSSSQFNHDLINAYQQCEVLYDCENVNYKAPTPTKDCWKFVADKCGSTPHECKVRWKALRDRYIKERKRRMLSNFDPTKKSWPLYNRMDFLDRYVEKQRQKFPRNGISKENQNKAQKKDYAKATSSSGDEAIILNSNFISENYDETFIDRQNESLSANSQLLKVIEKSNIKLDPEMNCSFIHTLSAPSDTFDISTITSHLEQNSFCNAENAPSTISENILLSLANNMRKSPPLRNQRVKTKPTRFLEDLPITQNEPPNKRGKFTINHCNEDVTSFATNSIVEALRSSSEALTHVTQSIFSKDAEGSFGEFVASSLRAIPSTKRGTVMKQILDVFTAANAS